MKNCLELINDYVDDHKEEMITLWQELVNLESYSREYEKVNRVAEWLKDKFEKEGLECELINSEGNAKTLVGIIGNERKGKEVILCGHTDTVFPSGAFGSRPFRIEGEKAFGPGVLDMKDQLSKVNR